MSINNQEIIDALQGKVYVIVELHYDKFPIRIVDVKKAVLHMENPRLRVITKKLTLKECKDTYVTSNGWKNAISNTYNTYYYVAHYTDIKTPLNI